MKLDKDNVTCYGRDVPGAPSGVRVGAGHPSALDQLCRAG